MEQDIIFVFLIIISKLKKIARGGDLLNNKSCIIAYDLGTTGNKATIFDDEGNFMASAFKSYQTYYPENWLNAVCNATKGLLEKSKINKSMLSCLTFSGQMMGCVPVDKTVGHRPSASYSAAKIMWIKDNEPDRFKRIYKVLHAKDFIAARMTGNFYTDYSDASGTN